MADTVGKHVIVIDLTNAADRVITSARTFIRGILISGSKVLGSDTSVSLAEGSTGGATLFRHSEAVSSPTTTYVQDFQRVDRVSDGGVFFNNLDGNVWAAGSVMLLYTS